MTNIHEFCAYPTDFTEEQSLEPIIIAAKSKGISIRIDRNMAETSAIGIFLGHHKKNRPALADYPIVMLHDLGQAHNVWPNFWAKEPWGEYSMGLLPNQAWKLMYDTYPVAPHKPKEGVKVVGWPKADRSYQRMAKTNPSESPFKGKRLRILYAPSWEFDNQQDKFLTAVSHLPVDVFIKQQYFEGLGHMQRVNEMAKQHRNRWPNVILLDPKTKIFEALKVVDCIVSDESSTMVEGFMVGCVPIAVMDWKVPDTNPPRAPSVPFPFVTKIHMADLTQTISSLTEPATLKKYRQELNKFPEYLPANAGSAANEIADLLEELQKGLRAQ